jgi:hypothetical protein
LTGNALKNYNKTTSFLKGGLAMNCVSKWNNMAYDYFMSWFYTSRLAYHFLQPEQLPAHTGQQ